MLSLETCVHVEVCVSCIWPWHGGLLPWKPSYTCGGFCVSKKETTVAIWMLFSNVVYNLSKAGWYLHYALAGPVPTVEDTEMNKAPLVPSMWQGVRDKVEEKQPHQGNEKEQLQKEWREGFGNRLRLTSFLAFAWHLEPSTIRPSHFSVSPFAFLGSIQQICIECQVRCQQLMQQ